MLNKIFDSKKGQVAPGQGAQDNVPFLVAAFGVILMFVLDGALAGFTSASTRIFLLLVMLLVFGIYSLRANGPGWEYYRLMVIPSIIIFLLPLAFFWLRIVPNRAAIIIGIFYFAWLAIIALGVPHHITIFDWLIWILMILIVILGIRSVMPAEYVDGLAKESLGVDLQSAKLGLVETVKLNMQVLFRATGDLFKSGWRSAKKEVQRQFDFYGGDYYTAKVDESKTGPKGIFLRDLESTSDRFISDQDISVWGTLEVESIDLKDDEEYEITIKCHADDINSNIKGKINEQDELKVKIYSKDFIDLKCTIPKNTLDEGGHSITFVADFDYETFSYLRLYFMSEEKQRELLRESIDPFVEYKIDDRTPITEYSQGPLSMGMGAGSTSLIAFPKENAPKIKFGITIDNIWEGKIKKMNDVIIKTPDGLGVFACTPEFEARDCADECIGDEKYERIYKMSSLGLAEANSRLEDSRVYGINCFLQPLDNIENFLGNSIIRSNYIKSTIRYEYEIESTKYIEVKEGITVCDEKTVGIECSISEICALDSGDYRCIPKCNYYARENIASPERPDVILDNTWSCACDAIECQDLFDESSCIYDLCSLGGGQCCTREAPAEGSIGNDDAPN